MTRWADTANDTAAGKSAVAMVTLCDIDFASGILYLHDGLGTLANGGHSYSGVGQYGAIDAVSEDLGSTAKTIRLTLSGVDASVVGSAMTEDYQGRQVTVYVGLLKVDDPLTWIAAPEVVWEGRIDYMTIEINQGTGTIALICESRLYREPLVSRYTDQDQQLAHAGDTFFNLLWQIPLATATWGATNVMHPGSQAPKTPPGKTNPFTGLPNTGPTPTPGIPTWVRGP